MKKKVSFGMVVGSHAIDVLFKISFLNKFSQSVLLKIGNGTGIKGKFCVKFVCQMFGQYHITDAYSGCKGFGKCIVFKCKFSYSQFLIVAFF